MTEMDDVVSTSSSRRLNPSMSENGQQNKFPIDMTSVRSYDGSEGTGGKINSLLARQSEAVYADDISEIRTDGPNPRLVSNVVCIDDGTAETSTSAKNAKNNDNNLPKKLTAMAFAFGQFLDHDISLSEPPEEETDHDIIFVGCDSNDPLVTDVDNPNQCIEFTRSDGEIGPDGKLRQINKITSYIDGSAVYGSDSAHANALRAFTGGSLKSNTFNGAELLPFNAQLNMIPGQEQIIDTLNQNLFAAGDVRVNEQVGLVSMHTLFLREHNRLAAKISSLWSEGTDEEIYQLARKIVGAEIQKITYEEFLPAIVGPMPAYTGYDGTVDASVMTEFSTAAYRFGHTLLPRTLLLAEGSDVLGGILLNDTFFMSEMLLVEPALVDQLIHGFVVAPAQMMDHIINDSVRNFLFGRPGEGGTDLVSLNIQRGRDHGLAGCSAVREAFGLPRLRNLVDVTADAKLRKKLRQVYSSQNDIDLWLCGLAEDPQNGSQLGPTFTTIIKEQFHRLRAGDQFYWENDPVLSDPNIESIIDMKTFGLADIIALNTGTTPATRDVFHI
jgi:hypothetical protein